MKEIVDHFEERAPIYNQSGIWVNDPTLVDITLDFLDIDVNSRIIDVGSGTGSILEAALARFSTIKVCVALDIAKGMLDRITDNRITKCLQDAHSIPFPNNYFNVAVFRQSLHYMENIKQVFREIHRVLINDGVIVISQITPFNEKDEEYWKLIIQARQPLRLHFLTLSGLLQLLIDLTISHKFFTGHRTVVAWSRRCCHRNFPHRRHILKALESQP